MYCDIYSVSSHCLLINIFFKYHSAKLEFCVGILKRELQNINFLFVYIHLKYPSHLETYKRTHTGEKPCKSDVCLKTLSQKPNLVTHYCSQTG